MAWLARWRTFPSDENGSLTLRGGAAKINCAAENCARTGGATLFENGRGKQGGASTSIFFSSLGGTPYSPTAMSGPPHRPSGDERRSGEVVGGYRAVSTGTFSAQRGSAPVAAKLPDGDDAVALVRIVALSAGRPPAFPLDVRVAYNRPVLVGREGHLRPSPDDRFASALHARLFGDPATSKLYVEDLRSRVGIHRRLSGLFRLEPGARLRFHDHGYRCVDGGLVHESLDPAETRPRPVANEDLPALIAALGPPFRRGNSLIGECPEGAEPVYERLGTQTELHVGDEILIGALALRVLAPRAKVRG